MATSEFKVNSNTGVDGNTYTKSISNDQLKNEDFLKLMIQELKLQDPTSPMDSKQMLQTQMQMSTISTNQEMIKVMNNMQTAFSQSTLSSAANMIGKNIEDGNIGENGVTKAYTVRSIENIDGEIQAKAQQILYMENKVLLSSGDEKSVVNYNVNGEILDENGTVTSKKIALESPGVPLQKNGKLVVLDEDNKEISEHNYSLAGVSSPVYSDKLVSIPFSNIKKVF